MTLAFERRKDLRSLQAQQELADRTVKAVKYERLPSLSRSTATTACWARHRACITASLRRWAS